MGTDRQDSLVSANSDKLPFQLVVDSVGQAPQFRTFDSGTGAHELIEVLADQRTLADDGAKFPGRGSAPAGPNMVQAAFARNLAEGRLPATITVIQTDEYDADDWIEFEFGDIVPAIAPLE